MNLGDAVAAHGYRWACACIGPQNGASACPCTLTLRELAALDQAAHIVARQLSDLAAKKSALS